MVIKNNIYHEYMRLFHIKYSYIFVAIKIDTYKFVVL